MSTQQPDRKKAKLAVGSNSNANATSSTSTHQSTLSSFFQPIQTSKTKPPHLQNLPKVNFSTIVVDPDDPDHISPSISEPCSTTSKKSSERNASSAGGASSSTKSKSTAIEPIYPKQKSPKPNVHWQPYSNNMVILRKILKEPPRTKIAGLDLDGTLMAWTIASGWPSVLTDYEVWNTQLAQQLRRLYDEEGYKLVVFSNQGAIRNAVDGKKSTTVKTVIDFLAHWIDRPLHAIMSTQSPKKAPETSFHKPSRKMWDTMVAKLNQGVEVDLTQSFFVGDSADLEDTQGGVDRRFADGIGIKFYTPTEYFGSSNQDLRKINQKVTAIQSNPTPEPTLQTRTALLGGYLQGPIVLILCGVQGSGKSTFCNQLMQQAANQGTNSNIAWEHYSQDTINNGKSGPREKVEQAARAALQNQKSVIIDRMHLDPQQRNHFISLAKSENVPVHVLLLNPPKDVISKRVLHRTNHPANVEGAKGAKIAVASLDRLIMPTYEEGLDLISCATSDASVQRYSSWYGRVGSTSGATWSLPPRVQLTETVTMPSIVLGTQNIGKRDMPDVLQSAMQFGFKGVDTAPTYKNEDSIGPCIENNDDTFCIVKIPKAVKRSQDVRPSLQQSLKNLKKESADLLLLHWPCYLMQIDELGNVWEEMEACVTDGLCKSLGVCNFNEAALSELFKSCRIRPALNQVERHPMLPQMKLLDFCAQHDVLAQAHTPLGQGSEQLLEYHVVKKVATESGMTAAQVCLQWNLQHGVPVAPKSKNPDHMKEIMSCKTLSPAHMKELDAVGKFPKRFLDPPFMRGNAKYCWDA